MIWVDVGGNKNLDRMNRMNRMGKRQRQKFLSCQSCSSCPKVLSFLGLSRGDFGTDRKKQKTYGRILGMIF
jgi:hypothetical protein